MKSVNTGITMITELPKFGKNNFCEASNLFAQKTLYVIDFFVIFK